VLVCSSKNGVGSKEKRSLKISIYIYIIYKINNNNVYIVYIIYTLLLRETKL